MTRKHWGMLVLRLGLAGVMLWFGFSQLFDGIRWVAYVPDWAVNLISLPPAMIVLANGIFEVLAGTLLAMGIWTGAIAGLLALHLSVITFSLGISADGVRDFGLVVALIALGLMAE